VSCTHTQALLDSLGRLTTQYLVNNPAGEVQVTSTYDGLNRVSTASHPNFGSTDPNDVVETSYYDGLSRPLKLAHPDGEYTQTFYGALVNGSGGGGGLGSQQGSTATYGYGYPVLSVDEAGGQRQEWIDGFGKVIEVDEPATVATPGTGSVTILGAEQSVQIDTCQVLQGGTVSPQVCDRTIWDAGTVSITVNGFVASTSYGEGNTDASIASSLASAFNGNSNSPVTATSSNNTIFLTSNATGSVSNYSLSSTSKTNLPTYFSSPSFSAAPSGTTLTGGSNTGSSLATPVVTNYIYDALGNLTEVVQGSQTPRTWTYDGLSRLTQEITPEAGTVTLSYGTPGALCSGNPSNPCTRTAPKPNQTGTATVTTTYSYNAANQLTQKAHSDTTGTEVYTYGTTAGSFNVGRLISMTDPSGSEAYTYDAIGRVTQLTKIVGTASYVTKYSYQATNLLYAGSQLTQITYPSGRVVQYSYDDVGHLCEAAVTAAANCGTATGLYLTLPSTKYDAASRPLGATYGNGVVAAAAYSPQTAELTSLSYANGSTTLFGLNYYYQQNSTNCSTGNAIGNNGQIQCIGDVSSGTGDSGRTASYTYDALGRLLTANTTGSTQYPAWGLSWTYDRYGNRTNQTVTAGSGYPSSLTISAANNQITTPGFTYDARGNVMTEPAPGAATYTYDAEECNTKYVGSETATYTCDGNELRVEKAITSGTTTVYIRSGGQVIAEYDNGAAVTAPTREYLYSDNLLAIVTGSSSGSGGTIIYQHRDHFSPRLYTNSSGNCVGDQGTYPYGELWYQNTDTECGTSATSSWIFTSYERDSESGDDYALARSYASSNGRFLSPDPLEGRAGDPQSWNRYAYVENDPINLSDPSGQGFWGFLGNFFLSIFGDAIESGRASTALGDNAALGNSGNYVVTAEIIGGGGGLVVYTPDEAGFEANEAALAGYGVVSRAFNPASGIDKSDVDVSSDIANNARALAPAMQMGNAEVQYFMAGQAVQVGVAAAVIAGPGVVTNIAARGLGWYYAGSGVLAGGSGVVIGRNPEYLDAAEEMGANTLNASRGAYTFFQNAGEWDTLNKAYLNAQVFLNQRIYLSNPPLGVPESTGFWMELQHLASRGVGPQQWQYVPLKFVGF